MAIDNRDVVDAIAVDSKNNALRLLLADHLKWEADGFSLSEEEHLKLLREKVNAYLAFLETKQYSPQFPDKNFKLFVIECHFKYRITENCQKLLQVIQNKVAAYGIRFEIHIG